MICALFYLGVAEGYLTKSKRAKATTVDVVNTDGTKGSCKHEAYLQTLNCSNRIENGSVEVACLTDVIINYVECTKKAETSIASRHLDPNGSGKLVRCILDNVLDLAKCIVDSELTGDFKCKELAEIYKMSVPGNGKDS
ncbi:hypothetical protein HW555_009721 [Spodoptera exigua]|uniref:Uncharacterized protein n=1 Tax=Spodoptera exigua TaxID=7107 RepID=A0A835L6H0_SPOEX|nr:hypothetical protein HW555_009721 [Spodoptera exigua]